MADSAEKTDKTEVEKTEVEKDAGETAKSLTQAEVDAIVEARLARERKKFADYDDLKSKAGKLDEIEAANLSELEKERKRATAAEEKASAIAKERDAERIRSAIVREASKQGAKSPDAVLRAVDKTELTVGDDGQVSGAEEAVKALLAEIPEFVGGSSASTGSADQGARGGSKGEITQEQLSKMSPEEIDKALRAGELKHLL